MEHKRLPAAEEEQEAAWASRVEAAMGGFAYPATPDIARAVGRRLEEGRYARAGRLRPGWAIAIVLLILAAVLLAVPDVRAALADVLRIGAVRIFRGEPAPQPQATLVPLSSVLDLAGATTLDDAGAAVDFPLRVPHYPAELGAPDAVFVQDEPGQAVIMAWRDRTAAHKASLVLYEIPAGAYFEKIKPTVIQETEVNGQPAIWAEGPYMLLNRSGNIEFRRLVEGNTLIWTDGSVTYRLETGLGLEEARRVAGSIR